MIGAQEIVSRVIDAAFGGILGAGGMALWWTGRVSLRLQAIELNHQAFQKHVDGQIQFMMDRLEKIERDIANKLDQLLDRGE